MYLRQELGVSENMVTKSFDDLPIIIWVCLRIGAPTIPADCHPFPSQMAIVGAYHPILGGCIV